MTAEGNGIGIEEGEKKRKDQSAGTGLGFAIAKEIVELHGCRVMVESEAGQGITSTAILGLVQRQRQKTVVTSTVWLPLTR